MTLEVVPPVDQSEAPTPKEPEFTKEFADQLKSLGSLSTINDLLQNGAFPHKYRFALDQGLSFVQALHKIAMDEALKDPQADLVPELVALKEARAKEESEKKTIEKAEEKRTRKAAKVGKNNEPI